MRIIKKRTIILIVLCVILGFYIGYKIFASSKNSKQSWIVPESKDISKKFITEETLVNEIHQRQQLITMEIDMAEKFTLDDSWGDLEIFKKIQNINYFGTGTYVIDLSNLKAENIEINNDTKEVTINMPKPSVKSVIICEEKTEYQTTENGLLRFGEIKLTPEENQFILKNIKEKMNNKMLENNFLSQAVKTSEEALKNIIESILQQGSTKPIYNIKIRWQSKISSSATFIIGRILIRSIPKVMSPWLKFQADPLQPLRL